MVLDLIVLTEKLPIHLKSGQFFDLILNIDIMRYLLFCTTMLLALGVASAQTTGYTQVNGQYFKYMVDDCGDTLIVADLDDISIYGHSTMTMITAAIAATGSTPSKYTLTRLRRSVFSGKPSMPSTTSPSGNPSGISADCSES